MARKLADLPMHIYHRIYRFSRRGIDSERIAVTLDLPLRTVRRVLERFALAREGGIGIAETLADAEAVADTETFLDVYIIAKVRYVVVDISGWAIAEHKEKLAVELDKVARSQWRVIALLVRDVMAIDDEAAEAILSFHERLEARGRYSALLDPSHEVEAYIQEHDLDDKIPIFGTEKTFEDTAFSVRHQRRGAHPIHP